MRLELLQELAILESGILEPLGINEITREEDFLTVFSIIGKDDSNSIVAIGNEVQAFNQFQQELSMQLHRIDNDLIVNHTNLANIPKEQSNKIINGLKEAVGASYSNAIMAIMETFYMFSLEVEKEYSKGYILAPYDKEERQGAFITSSGYEETYYAYKIK